MLNGIFRNNRPVMFLCLAIGFAIGSYFILSSKVGLTSAEIVSKFQQLINKNNQTVSADEADDDKDGLTNADEKKYGTNPQKADTDGDGYFDGEEILSGRDPLKKGSDDNLSITNKNLTELFNSILKNGLKNTSSAISDLPDAELKKQIQKYFLPSPITASQIKISGNNSKGALDNYLSAVRNIVEKYSTIINHAPSDDKIYQSLAMASENTFNELNKLAVPSFVAEKHIEILETLLILKNIDSALMSDADPVKKFTALKAIDLLLQQ